MSSFKSIIVGSLATVTAVSPVAVFSNASFREESVTVATETSSKESSSETHQSSLTTTVSQARKQLNEAEKYQERTKNPDLCRVVLASDEDKSKLQACRTYQDSLEIEFEYHAGEYGMPIPVQDLKFTHSHLVINLTKSDNTGFSNKRMKLSEEIHASKGLISSSVNGQVFTEKQCQLEVSEEDKDKLPHKGWKINCVANSSI